MNKEQAQKLLKKVKDDYAFGSEVFSKRAKPWESIFELIKNQVGKNKKVLDVGCGNGRYFEALDGKGVEYMGVDSCEGLIKKTRKHENTKTEFLVGDILDLPFEKDQFDYVLGIAVLHHIPSRELQLKALSEMHRVLKPGGKLIMTNWNLGREIWSFKHMALWLYGFMARKRDSLGFRDLLIPWGITGSIAKRYYYAFSLAELKRLVNRIGFKADKAYYVDRKSSLARWGSFWKRGNMVVVAKKK